MSTLSQFFSGGGGGIPSEVLVVNGGSGAWQAYVISINPYAPSVRCTIAHGQGGYVASGFFDITPGATCPVTVGYGGTSICRGPVGSPTPWCFFSCCVGGSGTASRFSSFGGTDRAQITSPTDGTIATPYGVNLLASFGCPFATQIISSTSPYLLNGACESFYGFCGYGCAACGAMACATVVRTAYQGGACMQFKTFCPSNCMSTNGLDSHVGQGYVSKITGTVQVYGSSKVYNWGFCGSGCGFPTVATFHLCKTRPHPSHLGTGSGHGAWWCEGSAIAACPGTVIIQYPSDYNAASVSSPNVCDCSPATPGFRTYRFLCPGSITFP